MKKLLGVVLVLVLICAFAIGVAAQGYEDKHPPIHECWFEQGCDYDPDTGLYYCWYLKCCVDGVWVPKLHGYVFTEPVCVSVI